MGFRGWYPAWGRKDDFDRRPINELESFAAEDEELVEFLRLLWSFSLETGFEEPTGTKFVPWGTVLLILGPEFWEVFPRLDSDDPWVKAGSGNTGRTPLGSVKFETDVVIFSGSFRPKLLLNCENNCWIWSIWTDGPKLRGDNAGLLSIFHIGVILGRMGIAGIWLVSVLWEAGGSDVEPGCWVELASSILVPSMFTGSLFSTPDLS